MGRSLSEHKRSAENTEAWILGSGTASLASALYLVKHANLQPSRVHFLEKHASLEEGSHHTGDSLTGYDQFAGCLPVPGGLPMKELLAMVPSTESPGRSILDEIQIAEANRVSAKADDRTCFLAQKKGRIKHIPLNSLNLSYNHRTKLILFLLKREKSLAKDQIRDSFPKSFFESSFWAIWSAQFGFQPWHSAAEFRRAVRQYLPEFQSLSILDCLDITGYYQFESLQLPIYHFLQSCGVDFQFDTQVKNIELAHHDNQRTITALNLIQGGLESQRILGQHDIVIANLGSTISGAAIGTNDTQPIWQSITADDMLDQNWSAWLDLGNKDHGFGDPYNFCTRQSESMLESFTVTTEDVEFFDKLKTCLQCRSNAGAFLFLEDSRWKINLCIPVQPVFPQQPQNVRVLWGLAHSPECEGNYVNKTMLRCSGTDIMAELLGHLNFQAPTARTITIPRAMPRMGAMLLTRALTDRPQVAPRAFPNVGLVGNFVEIPRNTCVDVSYGIRAAQVAVSSLMGCQTHLESPRSGQTHHESLRSDASIIWKVMFWR